MADGSTVPEVDAAGAEALVTTGAMLVDVREPDEWTAGHAPAAVHVPLGDVPASIEGFPTDRRIVCICRSGARSGRVVEYLNAQGFDAVNVADGMVGWAQSGRAVVDDDDEPGQVI